MYKNPISMYNIAITLRGTEEYSMAHTFQRDKSTALVSTASGQIRGYRHDGLTIFKGIPYASAKRFHAPEAVEPWKDVLDCASYGFVAPLLNNERPNGELYVPHRYWPMDERCQNLNVWTPGLDDAARPVLVWLHGGGYSAGSAIEHIAYDGANMSRLGDVVVVSINHRLNILGYFDLSDFGEEYANSGNAGGDDIIAALRWVRDNIAAFGGDPNNVTVFGQSGGGAKVTTLLQSPAADGLYAKGVIMSGVIGPVLSDARGSGKAMVEAVMKELDLSNAQALETVDYASFARAYRKVRPALQAAGENIGCCPHPNAFYKGEPVTNGFRVETSRVPLMIGSVFGEFSSFSPAPYDRDAMSEAEQLDYLRNAFGAQTAEQLLPIFRKAYPERHPIDLVRLDSIFRAPEIRYIAERSRLNECTWSYLFNMDQPIDGGNTPWHCSDIPYWFHNIDLVEYPHGDSGEASVSTRIQEALFQSIIAFARHGDPNNGMIPEWRACAPDHERTLVAGTTIEVKENFDHSLIASLAAREGSISIGQNVQH